MLLHLYGSSLQNWAGSTIVVGENVRLCQVGYQLVIPRRLVFRGMHFSV